MDNHSGPSFVDVWMFVVFTIVAGGIVGVGVHAIYKVATGHSYVCDRYGIRFSGSRGHLSGGETCIGGHWEKDVEEGE